jgi:Domain of unknown function (DUF4091)
MTDTTRNLILALLALLATGITLLIAYFSKQAPAVTPVPAPAPAPDPYTTRNVTTLQPSFIGAMVGDYPDILVPTGAVDPTPPPRGFPFYAELQVNNVAKAHGIADEGSTLARRGALFQKYIQLFRDFGVEPIKQNLMGLYPMDWDQWKEYGVSFRQLVLTGCIAPPCISGPTPNIPIPDAWLVKVEAAIQSGELPKGTWIYVEDEPIASQHDEMIFKLKQIRRLSPSLRTFVTTLRTPELTPLVDIFCPVFDQADGTHEEAYYTSCMAQGSCTNGTQGIPTGTPMMVVEADPIHPFAYPFVAAALGAKFAVYYCFTQSIATALLPGGQYFAGGNGDGNLVYPGDNDTALPSARLRSLRDGLIALAKIRALPDGGKAKLSQLVKSPKVWSKNKADYL